MNTKQSTLLCERAVLVDFTCKTWSGDIAEIDLVLIWKRSARRFHYSNTMPGLNHGWRILPAMNYDRYMRVMAKYEKSFNDSSAHFCKEYPRLLQDRKKEIKGANYPDEGSIWDKFAFTVDIMPLVDSGDIRLQLDDNVDLDAIKQDHEARLRQIWTDCMNDLWRSLYTVVDNISVKLTRYNNKEQKRFWDTLIENAAKESERIPRLNMAGDKNLDALAEEVKERICIFDPKDLRGESPHAGLQRDIAIMEADDILGKIKEAMP